MFLRLERMLWKSCILKGSMIAALQQTFRSLLTPSARKALVSIADISMSLGSRAGCLCIQQVTATSTGVAVMVVPRLCHERAIFFR